MVDAPIEAMLKAANQEIPAEAEYVSRIASRLATSLVVLDQGTAKMGEPPMLRALLRVGGDVFDLLSSASRSLDNGAVAVLKTAKHFVETDQAADSYLRQINRSLDNMERHEVPTLLDPDPEKPGYTVAPQVPYLPPDYQAHVDPTPTPSHPDSPEGARPEPDAQPDVPREDWD